MPVLGIMMALITLYSLWRVGGITMVCVFIPVVYETNCFIEDYLSSTEIFGVQVSSQWTEISPLPYRLYDPRATTVENKEIFLTG